MAQQVFRGPDGSTYTAQPGGGYLVTPPPSVAPSSLVTSLGRRDPSKDRAESREDERLRLSQEAADRAEAAALRQEAANARAEARAQREEDRATRAASGKPLSDTGSRELDTDVSLFAGLKNAYSSFDDEFAGNAWTGRGENWLQAINSGVGTPGQREFWSQYDAVDMKIRNAMFGASLTDSEKASYEAVTVTPRMDPATVRKNIAIRADIIQKALQRKVARLRVTRNTEEVDASLGEYASDLLPKQAREEQRLPAPTDFKAAAGLKPPAVVDYSEMSRGGDAYSQTPTAPDAKFKKVHDPASSGLIDDLIRKVVPYRKAVGQISRQFPGASPISPTEYNKALEYRRTHPNYKGSYGYGTKQVPLTGTEQVINSVAQSAPGALVGSFANAATAGLPALLAGDQGAYALSTMRERHPGLSLTGDVLGNVTGALGTGAALRGGMTALGGSGLVARNPGRVAAAGDMIYGSGYGAAQNPDDPLTGAAVGAGAMLAGNAAGRYLLAPAGRALAETGVGRSALDWASQRAGRGAFNPPAALPTGQRIVVNQADQAGLPDTLARLAEAQRLGLPYTLADANPQLRALAGSASRKSPLIREMAENTMGPRQAGQAERAIGMIDQHLARPGDIGAMTADATARARAATGDMYGRAMQQPAPDGDAALDDLLRTPGGERAAREAYTIALNRGENPAELSFSVDTAGNAMIQANPNWRTLQYMKMGLDSVVEKSRDGVTGRLNLADPSLRAMNDLRTRFTGRLHDLNDTYRAADGEYARIASQGSAAERGYAATAPRVSPTQLADTVAALPPENAPYFQRGYASALTDAVEKTRLASDPYNAIYGSTAQQAKLASVFPDGAPRFDAARRLEGDMSRTAYETIGGSPTAVRGEADRMFDDMGLAGGAAELGVSAATGVPPLGLLRQGVNKMVDNWRLGGIGRQSQHRANDAGQLLLNTNPSEAARILMELTDLSARRGAYVDQTRRIGGTVGAPLMLGTIPQN